MKWNEWNLIIFGLLMGSVVGATFKAVADPGKLLLGNDGRLQWETLLTGVAALGAAGWTVVKIAAQIRLTEQLATDQRRRQARAARAVLPLALAELVEYAVTCINRLYDLRPYFGSNGSIDPAVSREALSASWSPPQLPANVLDVLKECIQFVDDAAVTACTELIRHLQIQRARLSEHAGRLKKDDGVHMILWANIEQAMWDAAEIYARAMPLFVFARGHEVSDFTVKRSQVYEALSFAGCFRNVGEIECLASKWEREFSARQEMERLGNKYHGF